MYACPGWLGGTAGELPLMASTIIGTAKKERGREKLTGRSRGVVRIEGAREMGAEQAFT